MRAITVWAPWSSLILIGAKPYEFRPRPYTEYVNPPRIGERIAIHAGARPVRRSEVMDLIERLERNDPSDNPCLVRAIALPFLRRVLAGRTKDHQRGGGLLWRCSGLAAEMGIEPFVCPHSAILCTAVLGKPKRGDECAADFGRPAGNDSDREGTFNWGWPLHDIEPVLPHDERSGQQGFWEWTPPGEVDAA